MRAALITLILLFLPAPANAAEQPKTLVQFWVRGDDGLTQRFTLDLSAAIKATPRMLMVSSDQTPDIVVSILNHVRPQYPSDAFTYEVSVKVAENEKIYEGRCEEGASAACATELFARIVKELDMPPPSSAQ